MNSHGVLGGAGVCPATVGYEGDLPFAKQKGGSLSYTYLPLLAGEPCLFTPRCYMMVFRGCLLAACLEALGGPNLSSISPRLPHLGSPKSGYPSVLVAKLGSVRFWSCHPASGLAEREPHKKPGPFLVLVFSASKTKPCRVAFSMVNTWGQHPGNEPHGEVLFVPCP